MGVNEQLPTRARLEFSESGLFWARAEQKLNSLSLSLQAACLEAILAAKQAADLVPPFF